MQRFVNAVERVRNVVPHPVVIFLILIGGLIIISAIASLFGASAGVEFSKDGTTKRGAIATASPPAQMCSYPVG